MPIEYISLNEAAVKWHTKPWYIVKACDMGQVPGAAKLGKEWIVPADLDRPELHIPKNEPKSAPIEHGNYYKDYIYHSTMHGFPNFNVTIKEIGNTIYTVGGVYEPTAKYSFVEKMVYSGLREFPPGNVPDEIKKLSDEIIQNARAQIPSSEQLRAYYRGNFEKIGFTETEINELMEKIEDHIQVHDTALKSL